MVLPMCVGVSKWHSLHTAKQNIALESNILSIQNVMLSKVGKILPKVGQILAQKRLSVVGCTVRLDIENTY